MHCHCGTNNIALRWTSSYPYKPDVRPSPREELWRIMHVTIFNQKQVLQGTIFIIYSYCKYNKLYVCQIL